MGFPRSCQATLPCSLVGRASLLARYLHEYHRIKETVMAAHLPTPSCDRGERRRMSIDGSRSDPVLARRGIRSYTDEPVPDQMVRTLLQAAMVAHSAADERPWHFVVIRDRQTRDRIPIICPSAHVARQAPLSILVCGDPRLQKEQGFWVQDCAAAAENILIEAQHLGLGSMWLGVYPVPGRVQGFRGLLRVPAPVTPFALVALGHPAEFRRPADRYDESRVHYDRWWSGGRTVDKIGSEPL